MRNSLSSKYDCDARKEGIFIVSIYYSFTSDFESPLLPIYFEGVTWSLIIILTVVGTKLLSKRLIPPHDLGIAGGEIF